MTARSDVIVVGAGIIGLATARQLLRVRVRPARPERTLAGGNRITGDQQLARGRSQVAIRAQLASRREAPGVAAEP